MRPLVALAAPLALAACVAMGPRPERVQADDEGASRFVSVDGITLHLLDSSALRPADPARTPLLLVHGWMGSSHDYEPLIEQLPAELRVIALDLPGSGRSQKLGIDYSLDFFIAFLARAMEVLHLPRVVLVGHSFGGMLAVHFAHRYPERVERLVLIDPDGLNGEEEQWQLFRSSKFLVGLLSALNNRVAVWVGLRQNVFYDRSLVTRERVEEVAETGLTREGRRAQAQITLNVLGRSTVDELLPSIEQPALVVWGGEDRMLRPSWGAKFVSLLPNAALVVIPACGHLPQVEAPAATARALLAFLAASGRDR